MPHALDSRHPARYSTRATASSSLVRWAAGAGRGAVEPCARSGANSGNAGADAPATDDK
jgi:hypothetical protein